MYWVSQHNTYQVIQMQLQHLFLGISFDDVIDVMSQSELKTIC